MATGKNTGMVRNLDVLGRIVLPAELRRVFGIEIGDPLEFFVDDSHMHLRKYRTLECMFCASTEGLSYFKEYFICGSCLQQVSGNEKLPEGVVSNLEVTATYEEANSFKPKQTRSKDTLVRLVKIMEQYPTASQKKWAELIGVSQGRVSQLVQKLNNTAHRSSGYGG